MPKRHLWGINTMRVRYAIAVCTDEHLCDVTINVPAGADPADYYADVWDKADLEHRNCTVCGKPKYHIMGFSY